MDNQLPSICPRCESNHTIYMPSVEIRTCRTCDLSWWWSEDDNEIVNDGASVAWQR